MKESPVRNTSIPSHSFSLSTFLLFYFYVSSGEEVLKGSAGRVGDSVTRCCGAADKFQQSLNDRRLRTPCPGSHLSALTVAKLRLDYEQDYDTPWPKQDIMQVLQSKINTRQSYGVYTWWSSWHVYESTCLDSNPG